MKLSFYDQISKNKRNSIFLFIFVFFVLFSLIYVISLIFAPELSLIFLIFALIFVSFYTYSTYRYGDKIVLKSVNAKLIDYEDKKYLHLINVVEGLSIAAGIPKPKIYVMESNELNAFATGKNPENASICVTTGLLKNLNRDELEGVIGHELSHIKNYDIRFATLIAVMVGLVAIISHVFLRSVRFGGFKSRKSNTGLLILVGLLLAVISPIIVRLIQLSISRKREFLADASSVQLTRYPEGLASALEKISKINKGKLKVSEAVSHLFFVDPVKSALDSLYATHPPIEKRIEVLRNM
ncbi:MAG: M48 family metallopeptidase [Candidatus Aenigmarchaeota archaeon]|nr:M48 family metallopeptidase [Candidatus Aenigmarchaeota archaeon]